MITLTCLAAAVAIAIVAYRAGRRDERMRWLKWAARAAIMGFDESRPPS